MLNVQFYLFNFKIILFVCVNQKRLVRAGFVFLMLSFWLNTSIQGQLNARVGNILISFPINAEGIPKTSFYMSVLHTIVCADNPEILRYLFPFGSYILWELSYHES